MNQHVIFNTWAGAFFNPGGGEVQLQNTRSELIKKGWRVDLYDQWAPEREASVFHQFSIQAGVEYPMREYRNLGKRIALSTILWSEFNPESEIYKQIARTFALADVLLTNSDAESQKLANQFGVDPNKFHKTRNSVTQDYLTTQTQKDFRKTYQIESDFILSVANIDPRKNTHCLVEACMRLGKRLVLVGHIRDQAYFDFFKNAYDGMTFLGPITDPNLLKSAFQACELFALPSLCETPGIAALEAVSQGSKLVITREGPTHEYFGSHATYVDPLSVDAITNGIEAELKTQRDPKAQIEHILKHYTWDLTADDVVAGYLKASGA